MKERDGDGVIHVDCRLHFTLDDERRVAKEGNLARPASLMLIALLTMLWGNEGGREGEIEVRAAILFPVQIMAINLTRRHRCGLSG